MARNLDSIVLIASIDDWFNRRLSRFNLKAGKAAALRHTCPTEREKIGGKKKIELMWKTILKKGVFLGSSEP